jgi:hypothetical protein
LHKQHCLLKKIHTATFIELQKDVDALPKQEQDKLAAYLTMLRKSREPSYDVQLNDRFSEDAAGSWVAYDQVND